MMKEGLFEEVKDLVKKYSPNCHSFQAIGYKEFLPVINGDETLENAVELVKQHTRNYAKRQLTFIRHQFPVEYYLDNGDLWGKING